MSFTTAHIQALTGTSPTWDANYIMATLTASGDTTITVINAANPSAGVLHFKQDLTGSRALSLVIGGITYSGISVNPTAGKLTGIDWSFDGVDTAIRSNYSTGGSGTTTTETILAGASGLAPQGSSTLNGGVATMEILMYDANTKVAIAGNVNKVKFNLASVPSGINLWVAVWRKNGSNTYDLVGSKITATSSTLVVGTNTLIPSAPFAVQVGDMVGIGWTTGGTTAFLPAIAGTGVEERYSTAVMATTGAAWDAKTSSTAYTPIQLIQVS